MQVFLTQVHRVKQLSTCFSNQIRTLPSSFTRNRCEESMNTYQIVPVELGGEVTGVDLKKDIPKDLFNKIREDVSKLRLLIFKNQGLITAKRHVEISRMFGDLVSVFHQHPKAEHHDVFRVSNNVKEGCTNVGRTGWHIDGSFMEKPYAYSLYHMVSVPQEGDTVFAPLTEIIEGLPADQRERWERLWMVSDRDCIHPLIYSHPVTKKKVLCFHLGMTSCFIWDYNTSSERWTDDAETRELLREIHHEFVKDNAAIQYSHKWCEGDFIISDNLAVGHEASPDSQRPVEEVGLRILHRVTVAGTTRPSKEC